MVTNIRQLLGRGASPDPRTLWPHHDPLCLARRRLRGHRRRGQESHRLDDKEDQQHQRRDRQSVISPSAFVNRNERLELREG